MEDKEEGVERELSKLRKLRKRKINREKFTRKGRNTETDVKRKGRKRKKRRGKHKINKNGRKSVEIY